MKFTCSIYDNYETYWEYEEIVVEYLKQMNANIKIITICSIIVAGYIIYKGIKKFINWLNK